MANPRSRFAAVASKWSDVVAETKNILATEELEGVIDHGKLFGTHNLTLDIDHANIANAHNLTTDIDHNVLANTHGAIQPLTDVLTDISNLGVVGADGEFLVGTGAGTLTWKMGAAARTLLGIGSGDSITLSGLIPNADASNDIGLVEESEPEVTLKIDQPTGSSESYVSTSIRNGQTFTPDTSYFLARVGFKLKNNNSIAGNITLHLSLTDGGGLPTGGDLVSVIIDGLTLPTSYDWVYFDLETPYELTQDVLYAVWLSSTVGINVYKIYYETSSNLYPDGKKLLGHGGGTPWHASEIEDMVFRIYSSGEPDFTYTRWQNLYLSGLLHDGTVSLSVANAKAAYDHSLLTQGFVDRTISAYDWEKTDLIWDNDWHDLDLSDIVPTGVRLVLLYNRLNLTGGGSIAYREKGTTGEWNEIDAQNNLSQQRVSIIVPCDADQVIEYNGKNVTWTTFFWL